MKVSALADLAFVYERAFEEFRLRLSFNVYNVLKDTTGFVEVGYPDTDSDGVAITRYRNREKLYVPRLFQFSASFMFGRGTRSGVGDGPCAVMSFQSAGL